MKPQLLAPICPTMRLYILLVKNNKLLLKFVYTFRSLIVVSALNLLSELKEFNELVIKTFTTAMNKIEQNSTRWALIGMYLNFGANISVQDEDKLRS